MTIKVVRGNPTPEELAAALAVVRARAAAADAAAPAAPAPRAAWSDPSRIALHRLPHPSRTAWTRSTWPS
ncbi:acyl-CoA carboxylase epsilon subunit [Streptomyces sp. NPDC005017]|uniref:acyl-CoA carboxylase epsilon subunit n=1 Tax=Streptomyces sp. NPDC005017 TaxID=3364706 RepID=UPI0036BA79F5